MPRSIFEEMKYLEIMIVSDHSMVCVLTQSRNIKSMWLTWTFNFSYYISGSLIFIKTHQYFRSILAFCPCHFFPQQGVVQLNLVQWVWHCVLVSLPHLIHLCLVSFSLSLQFKRHKTKQYTNNFAKSVVNLVDAVSKLFSYPLRNIEFMLNTCTISCCFF